MKFEILTLFPSMFESVFSDSILKRAIDKGVISISTCNFREFTSDRHQSVDDYPYGGAPGMVLKPEPIAKAITFCRQKYTGMNPKVVYLGPHGKVFNHNVAKELAREDALIFLCGRYKGIDNRLYENYIDMEISVGDFIVSGGEIPTMLVIDAVTRLLPNALGNELSASCDSFYHTLLAAPQYTRPEEFEGQRVPDVLLSGHHANITKWQQELAIILTKTLRPDLWMRYCKENNIKDTNKPEE